MFRIRPITDVALPMNREEIAGVQRILGNAGSTAPVAKR